MAYDAATGTVVLFSGSGNSPRRFPLDDTWTWNGATWTKQAPATRPTGRREASMAYDAAIGTVVLFGGYNPHTGNEFDGTWVWDGHTWTRQAPATSPPARHAASMAYDAATGNMVLFGGAGQSHVFGDTWTWG
jgi:hypothetical protein